MKKYTLRYQLTRGSATMNVEVRLDISRDAVERAKKILKDGLTTSVRLFVHDRCVRIYKQAQPKLSIPKL